MQINMGLPNLPRVLAGFPGVGKSTLFRNDPERYADSDSSTFDKANFPANYIEHIQHLLDTTDKTIFVSTHDDVRAALDEAGIQFVLVYPDASLKPAFMERYAGRGSPQPFLDLMHNKFDDFVQQCEDFESSCCNKVKLTEPDQNMQYAMQSLGFKC